MQPSLVTYTGMLLFNLSATDAAALRRELSASRYQFTFSDTQLDVEYSGRDTGREMQKELAKIAPFIQDADGEVECVLDYDNGEREYEFYTIKGGRLLLQRARLVREKAAPLAA